MELSQEILIETLLNAVVYIAVSVLSIVIYSMFQNRNRTAGADKTRLVESNYENVKPVTSVIPNNVDRMKFISFENNNGNRETTPANNKPAAITQNGKRDRKDIIRIAKEMLKTGATQDKILSVLPISEAELALLTLANK